MSGIPSDAIAVAVRAVIGSAGSDITARKVRNLVEHKLGLPIDGLLDRKDEVMAMISAAVTDVTQPQVDPLAVTEAIRALEDDNGPAKAALLVAELHGEAANRDVAEAMLVLSEVCVASQVASTRLLEAHAGRALTEMLLPAAPKTAASLAARMLSAMSTHPNVSEAIIKSGVVPAILARLGVSIDGVGIQCAALCHNLADSPSNRIRLMHAHMLMSLTRVMVEPAASDSLKEHCLTAAASLAGKPDSECSFPELLGTFLCQAPGTQREALSCLDLIREKQPGVDGRLAQVAVLMQGLAKAATSTDKAVAESATQELAAIRAAS
uniref:Armadillo repeat-containing protein 8 n=1 Tax=Haptolina brevifila TaxID=156173 RepID=A0A7S2IDG2_9EUKA|mmetsp:Transcript_64956/g.128406  ORF Transcript_64956/g.128406 Transcript_64956/m.128406 type:complete len:324 (+) Transcript_64956:84-1055(+)